MIGCYNSGVDQTNGLFKSANDVPWLDPIGTQNRSHTITVYLDIPKGGADGVVAATGRVAGGFTLYVKNGKPVYEYNLVSLQRTKITSTKSLVPRKNVVRVVFRYDGGGLGKEATVSDCVRETVRAVEGLILDGGEYATIAQVALLLTGF